MKNLKSTPMISGKVEQLKVEVFDSPYEGGKKAAIDFTTYIRTLLETQSEVRCIFATAPSQN